MIVIKFIIYLIIFLFCIPFIYLFQFGISNLFSSINNLFTVYYFQLIFNTIALVLSVTFTTIVISLFLSWATEICKLKFAKLWRILLIFPLVIPSYLAGYLFILFYGTKGEIYQLLNNFGITVDMPDVYGFWGAWLCLSLICFPYVYINLSTGLKLIDRKLEDASRVLGHNHFQTFFRIIFPNIKNSLFAGSILVALYTLSDFGAVSALQFNTFTLAIYTKYRSFDFPGAASSALILILISMPIIFYSIKMSVFNSYKISQKTSNLSNLKLFDLKQYEILVQLIIFFIVLTSIFIPFLMIFNLILRTDIGFVKTLDLIKWSAVFNTFSGATINSILCVFISLLLVLNISKKNNKLRLVFENLMYFGYTLPGLVIALAFVYFSINYFFSIYQTWIILILGYTVLFLAAGYAPVRTNVHLVGDKYTVVSKSLGKSFYSTFTNILFPLYLPGILKGFLNVFILTAKELPVTLILAPLNFYTLSTVIWDNLEEANFSAAGIGSFLLILIISIPTYLSVHVEDIKIKFSKTNK